MAEASADRLARLLVLVPWLAAHSGIAKADAARHFGRTVKQLESDLQLLTFTGPGLYGGELVDIAFEDETVTVYDHQGLSRPVELSGDEAAALLVGLNALQQLPDIDAALVARVIDKLGRYRQAHQDVDVRVQASPHAATIARALAEQQDLSFRYRHPLRDDLSERHVTPVSVITRDGIDYLTAWCHGAGAMRTFRLDRMQDCVPAGISAPLPTPLAQPVGPAREAVVMLPAHAAHLLEHVECVILERGSAIRASVRFADEQWLAAWVLTNAPHIRVLEPLEVVTAVRSRAHSAQAAYAALGH